MQFGQFPGFKELNRRTNRAPINPIDKSTIVSIYPKEIYVRKLTLIPGQWTIPPGSVKDPALLVVEPSSWFKEVDPNESLLEIPTSSVVIAESIVKDWMNGIFGCDMNESQPGLFFIPGAFNKITIASNPDYRTLLERAIVQQTNYYNTLVRFADAVWAESSGNPMVITPEMRLAARTLGIEDRDWMKDHQRQDQVRCHACGSFKSPQYPVCPACRAVDTNHPSAKDLKFAQQ